MWILTIRAPAGEPREQPLHAGNNTIGRMAGNDIVILDPSASRYHAKVVYDESTDQVTAYDLDSTNGTFVNRDRLTTALVLKQGDVIRIGQHLMELSQWEEKNVAPKTIPQNTHALTRELVLESLDRHAVLLAEVASRLNTMLDLPTALREVASMMKDAMAADRCEVILPDQFAHLTELGFATSIAKQSIEQRSAVVYQDAQKNPSVGKSAYLLRIHAAMCVPVISSSEILGLIYVFKNRPSARPFEQRDLQLAIAISHQAALTIQRMQLIERVRKEELATNLLRRFLSPQETEFVLKEYFETGQLPPLSEYTLTVLAADICDSTGMAERLGARRFGKILSRYYHEMSDVIFKNHGMLTKYAGDGLMAIFGVPHQPPEPERRAIEAAIEILQRLRNIEHDTGELISLGIGINTGMVMAGYLGSLEYVEFVVLGYPVNIAWDLEALARPNRIVIGHPTYQIIQDQFRTKSLGTVEVKSQHEPIQAYEIIPPPLE